VTDASHDNLKDEVNRLDNMINSPKSVKRRFQSRKDHGYIRPRNASTIVVLDGPADNPKILMGKRNQSVKFMPGALVFPGGSVDKYDGSVPVYDEMTPSTQTRLLNAMRDRPTQRGAKALGVAAIRELSEESGLLIGKPGDFKSSHADWQDFAKQGIIPSLSGLRLFARAITPPGLARRFDTWFFVIHASEIGFTPSGGFEPDGELEGLEWISPETAITENTREITRVMIVELIRRLRQDKDLSDIYPAPYYHTVGSHFQRKEI